MSGDLNDPSVPREPRSVAHDALLAIAALMVIGAQFLSDRPLGIVNRPSIDDVAAMPAASEVQARYADFIYAYTYRIPKLKRPNAINFARKLATSAADRNKEPPVRIGYSIREFGIFGMPFWAYKEVGYSLYFDNWNSDDEWQSAAPMDDAGLAVLRNELDDPNLAKGWIFPYWAHLWGWIPLLLAAAWGWLQWRRMVRRREQMGIL